MTQPVISDLKQFVSVHAFPTDILVETVSRCNLACAMCPQDSLTRPVGIMAFDTWKKIVREVAEKSPATRLWPALMGEPLMTKGRIFEMIRIAKDQGVREVHLNSNLTLFQSDMLDPLFDSGLDHLIVGIDAVTPETFARIRVRGDYHKVLENIDLILDERKRRTLDCPRVTLQFITMDENEHELDAFAAFWRSSGKDVILKLKPRTGWASAVAVGESVKTATEETDERIPCTWLLRQMTVFWDGTVPQCDGDWNGEHIVGDVATQSLEEIWLGPLKAVRDRHLAGDFDFPPCRRCNDWAAGRATWLKCGEGVAQAAD